MNKRNFIMLAVLALLVVSLLVSRSCENVEKRFDLFKINHSDIGKIQLKDQTNQLVISLVDNVWTIQEPIQTLARESQMTRFFENFITLTASTIHISESHERQNFYHVDSTGVEVTIYDKNNKKLTQAFIGRNDNNPMLSYFRYADKNQIYQIDNVQSIVNPMINTWREDKIVNITQDNISKISFGNSASTYELFQDGMGWSLNLNELTAPLGYENADVNRLIQAILNLRTSTYFDNVFEEYEDKLATTELEIYIEPYTGSIIHLKIAKNDDNSYVLQKNDEYITLYRLTTQQFNQLNIEPENLVPVGDNLPEIEGDFI